MIGKAIRNIPWRVVIPGTLGGLLYLGWIEIMFAGMKVFIEKGFVDQMAHVKPREFIVRAVIEGQLFGAAVVFIIFGIPFLAGMLCAVAMTRNLKINKGTITTPLYAGMVIGSLLTVRLWKRKRAGPS